MSTGISAVYSEFTDALTEILAENAVGPARRGRLARAHAAVKKHARLQRLWISSGGRNGIQELGGHTKRRRLGRPRSWGNTADKKLNLWHSRGAAHQASGNDPVAERVLAKV